MPDHLTGTMVLAYPTFMKFTEAGGIAGATACGGCPVPANLIVSRAG